MKKIIAIFLTAIMAMSCLAINASADHYIDRDTVIESNTPIAPGEVITFKGMKLAQVSYYPGSFDIYEVHYDGVSSSGYDYFEDIELPSGFVIKDLGSISTGHMTVDGSPQTAQDEIDFDVEHCVFTGWKVTSFQNTSQYIQIVLEATWEEDPENPFPEPAEPTLIEIIIEYLKEAANFLMGILAQIVAKIMEYLEIIPTE